MNLDPETFINKMLLNSCIISLVIIFYIFVLNKKFNASNYWFILIIPSTFIFIFLYLMKIPEVKVIKKSRDINMELIYATRFIIIELESGVSIYKILSNLKKNYPAIGDHTNNIMQSVNMGTDLELALQEEIKITPNKDLKSLFYQILNSIQTGSQISESLYTILDQIIKEQKVEIQQYGRKLNPIAMFYMMFSIIFPTLGITMLIILAIFIGFTINLQILLVFIFLMAFIQFMFLSVIRSSRPSVDF